MISALEETGTVAANRMFLLGCASFQKSRTLILIGLWCLIYELRQPQTFAALDYEEEAIQAFRYVPAAVAKHLET
jgi:hypothetical protein